MVKHFSMCNNMFFESVLVSAIPVTPKGSTPGGGGGGGGEGSGVVEECAEDADCPAPGICEPPADPTTGKYTCICNGTMSRFNSEGLCGK
jgi:hypothetical protein